MIWVWYFVSGGLLLSLAMLILGAVRGPGIYDRLQAAVAVATVTVLLLSVVGVATGQAGFLDTSVVYALMGFILVLAVLKFFEQGNMARGGDSSQRPGPEA
ncbi:MAG: monovalent cation/H+ antiporter complex subunit F [Candidatus Porifericomitaceae bacterium WSBS_2022_MAG_OTU9]